MIHNIALERHWRAAEQLKDTPNLSIAALDWRATKSYTQLVLTSEPAI